VDKDVYLFFCSTVAQSVAGMLAFFGAFAMFRISEAERILAGRSEGLVDRLEPSLKMKREEARIAQEHLLSGRYRDFAAAIEAARARLPATGDLDFDTDAAVRALVGARNRREFLFTRGREVLVTGMLAVLAALLAIGVTPADSIGSAGVVVAAALLLATAWTLMRGIAIVLGRLPDT